MQYREVNDVYDVIYLVMTRSLFLFTDKTRKDNALYAVETPIQLLCHKSHPNFFLAVPFQQTTFNFYFDRPVVSIFLANFTIFPVTQRQNKCFWN